MPAPPARPTTAALRREAGQTIVLRIRGTTAPAYVLRALRERRVAGVILFRDNVVSAPQLRRMTAAFQQAAGGRALVMIDQEGGAIRNVPWAAPVAAPPAQTTTAAAREASRATARDLRAVGVNVNLAPVADVGSYPGSVMRSRAYPGDATQVAALVAEAVRGYARSGVLPTVKHFPGFGRSQANTDFALATVPGQGDPAPFAAAIRAGVPLVMASHALHPELDPDRIASQSPAILQGLLRERLRFGGACITDSLEAQAVVRRTSTPVAAERSMRAGCDLLLTTGRGVVPAGDAPARGERAARPGAAHAHGAGAAADRCSAALAPGVAAARDEREQRERLAAELDGGARETRAAGGRRTGAPPRASPPSPPRGAPGASPPARRTPSRRPARPRRRCPPDGPRGRSRGRTRGPGARRAPPRGSRRCGRRRGLRPRS